MQLLDDLRDVGSVPVVLKTLVYDVDRVISAAVIVDARHVQARLEFPKYGAGHNLKAFPRFVVLVDHLFGSDDCRVPLEPDLLDDVFKPEVLRGEERAHHIDGFEKLFEQFLLRLRGIFRFAAVFFSGVAGKGRQRTAEVLQDAAIVDDETVVLSLMNAVRPSDGLHQRMRLKRFVEIERGKALHVEPGEPHSTNDGDAEWMAVLFKGAFDIDPLPVGGLESFLDQLAMWRDIEVPIPELADLALFFAYHDGDLRFLHPGKLPPLQRQSGFVGSHAGEFVFKFSDAVFPGLLDQSVHLHGGDLVDGDEHRLAAFPRGCVVRDEIPGDGFEPLRRRYDVVVAP